MNSMTAFSRTQVTVGEYFLVWEIKSVNHRFLDLFFRLPDALRMIEPQVRGLISQYVSRGRVEINLQFKNQSQQLPTLNEDVLDGLMVLSGKIAEKYQIVNDVTVSCCLSLPYIWTNQQAGFSESQLEEILESFKVVMAQLVGHRAQEGQAIEQLLMSRVEHLSDAVQQIKEITRTNQQGLNEKIQQKLQYLIANTVEQGRLEQELAFQLMRLDIFEEIDRLETHLSEIKRVISAKGNNGRRLDFLVQELHRETNTIGSKTDSKQVSQLTIDMKVSIEQMREQIQNVE